VACNVSTEELLQTAKQILNLHRGRCYYKYEA